MYSIFLEGSAYLICVVRLAELKPRGCGVFQRHYVESSLGAWEFARGSRDKFLHLVLDAHCTFVTYLLGYHPHHADFHAVAWPRCGRQGPCKNRWFLPCCLCSFACHLQAIGRRCEGCGFLQYCRDLALPEGTRSLAKAELLDTAGRARPSEHKCDYPLGQLAEGLQRMTAEHMG